MRVIPRARLQLVLYRTLCPYRTILAQVKNRGHLDAARAGMWMNQPRKNDVPKENNTPSVADIGLTRKHGGGRNYQQPALVIP
jgi:hypothetical protein